MRIVADRLKEREDIWASLRRAAPMEPSNAGPLDIVRWRRTSSTAPNSTEMTSP